MNTFHPHDYERVYINYFAKLKRFAKEYVISEAEAENIVHDVFLELWEKKEALNFPINLVAFLFTAIKNRSMDYLKHEMLVRQTSKYLKEEQNMILQMKFESLEAFDQNIADENALEALIQKAIDTLPEKCKEIFVMSKIEGKKHKEIALELNISINTIESQMGLAYKKLRVELKDYLPLLFFLS
ncbi:DNA-directed RNA polymerase sigma-70 factor [Bacteroidales bacterium]|nr:DNA-directed RNA polymerase sigma-70 factor [Bacteroidales bacterium]